MRCDLRQLMSLSTFRQSSCLLNFPPEGSTQDADGPVHSLQTPATNEESYKHLAADPAKAKVTVSCPKAVQHTLRVESASSSA